MTDLTPIWTAQKEFAKTDNDELPAQPYADEWLAADWTLAQALAWAVERTPAWVRRVAPFYMQVKRPDRPLPSLRMSDVYKLLVLRRWPGESAISQATTPKEKEKVGRAEEQEQHEYVGRWWDDLLHHLAAGTLTARGIPVGQSDRVPIPPELWQDADHSHVGKPDVLAVQNVADPFSNGKVRFKKVRVRRADVLVLWPNPAVAPEPPPPPVNYGKWDMSVVGKPPGRVRVINLVKRMFPDGTPNDVTQEEAILQIHDEIGSSVSTIERALGLRK